VLEAGQSLWIGGHFVRQKLERNETVKTSVFGLVGHTHPAAAEFLEDVEMVWPITRDRLAPVSHMTSTFISRAVLVAAPLTFSRPCGVLLELEIMRAIESSNLRVDGIVETCTLR
jgi:hypothetical protein